MLLTLFGCVWLSPITWSASEPCSECGELLCVVTATPEGHRLCQPHSQGSHYRDYFNQFTVLEL